MDKVVSLASGFLFSRSLDMATTTQYRDRTLIATIGDEVS